MPTCGQTRRKFHGDGKADGMHHRQKGANVVGDKYTHRIRRRGEVRKLTVILSAYVLSHSISMYCFYKENHRDYF